MRLLKTLASWLNRIRFRERYSGDPRHELGVRGEAAAEKFLQRQGYKILARRLRIQLGELDLVAVEGHCIVFVEVKTRQEQGGTDHPADAVDAHKQRRITRAAVAFLKRRGLLEYPGRFDVVAVTWPAAGRRPRIEHIKNAYEAVGRNEFFS